MKKNNKQQKILDKIYLGNKKFSIILSAFLIAILLSSVALLLFGCKDNIEKKPSSVLIEVYYPDIEEKISHGELLCMKYDGKPKVFQIKIYSVNEKKYLTNDDLVRKDLNSLIVVTIKEKKELNSTRIDISDEATWPTEIGEYTIDVNFNGFVVKDWELDPNYKGTGTTRIELHIKEDINND